MAEDGSLSTTRLPRSQALRVGGGWPKAFAIAAAGYAIVGGSVTLIGWATDAPQLTGWKNDGISMFPNTALCVVAIGAALGLNLLETRRARTLMRVLSGLVVAIAGLTLVEHATGISLGIDTLLWDRPWGQLAAAAPMRMGPPASISLLMLGSGLWLLSRGLGGASAALGVAATALAMLSLVGHLYGAQQMYTIPLLTGIAMQTASMILALGVGLVASIPDREPMRTVLAPSGAGAVARRAWPGLVVLAVALGWARVLIQDQGLVDTALGTALRTLIEIVLFTILLWWATRTIREHEDALRESEAELRTQAAQLAAFLETAAICMHRVGPDGIILWANDAELKLLGYHRDEYVGHHVAEFHADRAAIADILQRLQRGEKLLNHAAQMRCKDGSLKSVLVDSSVLWEDGRFVHTQCFTRDVTESHRAEVAQARLAAIVETSDDAIISKTLDGIITSWNAAAERLFGHSAAEAIGRSIEIIIPPDGLAEEREIIRRLRRGERIEHFETVRRRKNGDPITLSLSISPIYDSAGRIIGASKIARDVTDRRRFEAEREESNRRKDEFIAILAHELRNPLAPVRTAAHVLARTMPPDPALKRLIAIIERQVAQMSRLIDDLLDVSRISRGIVELRRERVALTEIVEAALDACRDEIHAKGHELRTHLPAEPLELEADRERLVQVLCNVLGNAAKYTPPGGRIELTAGIGAPGVLEVSVKDNGAGIPPGMISTIFDLFARVDHSLERQGGLGIGLTLARQLLELHGGTIEARSAGIGQGSEFRLRLPVVVTEPAAAEQPSAPRTAVAPLRILVADDNRDAAESLVLLLQLAGHEAHAVHDGEAAIAAAETFRPQVALVDIGMPKANGYDVARRIRAAAWGRGIYLVALTGWGNESDKERAREAGFDAHLVKPVPPEALEHLLAPISRPERGAKNAGLRVGEPSS